VDATEYDVSAESHRQNPSWCLLVTTTYFMPAFAASAAHDIGSKRSGSKWSRYG
jgi:hypothetical protein